MNPERERSESAIRTTASAERKIWVVYYRARPNRAKLINFMRGALSAGAVIHTRTGRITDAICQVGKRSRRFTP